MMKLRLIRAEKWITCDETTCSGCAYLRCVATTGSKKLKWECTNFIKMNKQIIEQVQLKKVKNKIQRCKQCLANEIKENL